MAGWIKWGINSEGSSGDERPARRINLMERGFSKMCQCPQCGEDEIYFFDDGGSGEVFIRTWDCPNCGYRDEVVMHKETASY
jgi:C4-type Zn-finger protein